MNKKQNAFTLIELLVIMALIGVLASIVMVSLNGAIKKARMAKVLKFSQGIQNALGVDIVLNLSFDDQVNPTRDASGYGNDGTISGAGFTDDTPHKVLGAGPAQGKYALYFDGKDDYVDCGNKPSLNITEAITIEAWVKANVLSEIQDIVSKNGPYMLALNGDKVRWGIYIIGSGWNFITSLKTLSVGKWYHLVGSYDSSEGQMRVYVNGVFDNSTSATGTMVSTTAPVFIGAGSETGPAPANARRFKGSIDEVRIYSQALTAFEIQKHYVEGASRHEIVLR